MFTSDALASRYGIEFVSAGPCPTYNKRHATISALAAGGSAKAEGLSSMLTGAYVGCCQSFPPPLRRSYARRW